MTKYFRIGRAKGPLSLIVAATLMLSDSHVSTSAQTNQILLPDIGDPASAVLSRAEERRMARVILTQVRAHLPVMSDPELNTYIQSLGTRLVTAGLDSDFNYTFVLLQDPAINAFAAPGGVIAFNSGLLTEAQTESELAGVAAHEIAHVDQRHLARAYANSKKISVATALGVLASVVAGVYAPQVGGAALQSTVAAGQQARLAFTRSNEQEADRVGMVLLVNANFDPQGMPSFFERLHKATGRNAGPIMEYLSTHPVTISRISDTKNRAVQYHGEFITDSARFRYARARTIALTSTPASVIDYYAKAQRRNKKLRPTEQYTYAVALTRAGNASQAIKILSKLKEGKRQTKPVQLALAQAYLRGGQLKKAEKALTRLNEIYPNEEAIVYYMAKTLIDQGRTLEALKQLENISRYDPHNPIIDKLQAEAAMGADQPWVSHESMADYYIAYGQFSLAQEQLELALNDSRIDSVTQARVRSKHRELRELTKRR